MTLVVDCSSVVMVVQHNTLCTTCVIMVVQYFVYP